MNRYLVKPLFWNFRNYSEPTGAKARSGYPAKYGFGHEEWNNNPRNRIAIHGVWHRVFHVTGLPSAGDSDSDNTTIFFISSRHGVQYLVGIASNVSEIGRAERLRVQRRLRLRDQWKDAWLQPTVKKAFKNSESRFRKFWRSGSGWDINWKCPESDFNWFVSKQPIDARKITGKKKLPLMYGAYQELTPEQAERLMLSIRPNGQNSNRKDESFLVDLRSRLQTEDETIEDDVKEIIENRRLGPTTKKALIDARRGQGRFRGDLMKLWRRKCCVTSCSIAVALRASHIRPWATSNTRQRLDPQNGLLLTATLDALFDRGWITFENNGKIRISSGISLNERKALGLDGLRIRQDLSVKQKAYLAHHRRKKFDRFRKVK